MYLVRKDHLPAFNGLDTQTLPGLSSILKLKAEVAAICFIS